MKLHNRSKNALQKRKMIRSGWNLRQKFQKNPKNSEILKMKKKRMTSGMVLQIALQIQKFLILFLLNVVSVAR
jgi:preprotein translocase subunit SecA